MNIFEEVKNAKTIGISGHVRPDGDCIGSCMGLYLYLKKVCPGARVQVMIEKPADIFSCINDIEEINSDFEPITEEFDVYIALDAEKSRLGEAEKFFDKAKKKINIDHHISNAKGSGDINYIVPGASSTSELIYQVIADKSEIDVQIAKALYIGIIHDTGVFQYSNTSPETLRIAAELIAYGFDFSEIIDKTFYEKTYLQNQILGRALLESILFMDGRCVVSVISKKTMSFYNAKPYDLDGIVSELRNIKGVECAVFMYQTDDMEYKVSLRSGGIVNVAEIAALFGGGGHVKAAGVTMKGTFYDIINKLSEQIEKQLKKNSVEAEEVCTTE